MGSASEIRQEFHNMREVSVNDIRDLVCDVVGNNDSASLLNEHSALLGAIPELDSIGVVNLMLGMERRFGFLVHDEEVEVEIFETVGSLRDFAQRKLAAL